MPTLQRALVIAKRSAYDVYVRQGGMQRVKDLLARHDPTVARMLRADEHHARTVAEVERALEDLGVRYTLRTRDRVAEVSEVDLVITVGGDGTLLSVSHGVGEIPMLGVNSAPLDSVGYLCAARMGQVRERLEAIVTGEATTLSLARMAVLIDGEPAHQRVLNDVLFTHPHPANTTRYLLSYGGVTEEQKSSGIWIATATGSTGAIRSAGGRVLPLRSKMLQFLVREPCVPTGDRFELTRDLVRPGHTLEIANKMREARLYLDGPRLGISVEIGQRVSFALSDEPLSIYGVSAAAMDARG